MYLTPLKCALENGQDAKSYTIDTLLQHFPPTSSFYWKAIYRAKERERYRKIVRLLAYFPKLLAQLELCRAKGRRQKLLSFLHECRAKDLVQVL